MNSLLRYLLGAAAVLALLAGCSTPPPAPSAGPQVQLWLLGHDAIHITTPSGKVIMLDPWLTTNPKTPAEYKDLDKLGKGGTLTPLPGVKVTAVRADHASEFNWTNPATNKQEIHVGGEPVGYIIELENGFKISHMGDTALFGDMKLIG